MIDDLKKKAGQWDQESEQNWQRSEAEHAEPKSMRGGTREQHVKAGKAGGKAPHRCRGRQCTAQKK